MSDEKVSTYFDPRPNAPYGHCVNCSIELPTEEAATAHMHETAGMVGNASHSVRITNMTRKQRIESEVRETLDDAIREAIDEIGRLTYSMRSDKRPDATEEEITEAVKSYYTDPVQEWEEWLKENSDDE